MIAFFLAALIASGVTGHNSPCTVCSIADKTSGYLIWCWLYEHLAHFDCKALCDILHKCGT